MRNSILILITVLAATAGCDNKPHPQNPKSQETVPVENQKLEETQNPWRDSPYEPTYVDMSLIQVGEHTYYAEGTPGSATEYDGFIANAGVIVTDDGVVVFDVLGTPSLGYLLLANIRELTDKPIRLVIASHYHADHIYGLQVFKDQGAEIWAPTGAKLYLESAAASERLKERQESLFPWVDENTRIIKPDLYINDTRRFQLGSVDFSIIPLGATHSQGDLMLRVETDGVLYSGDLIFHGRIPFIAGDTIVWLKQLRNLDLTGVHRIVPGHGSVYNDASEAIDFTIAYLQYLHDSMGKAVNELIPFAEAYEITDWSYYKKFPAFVANRLNANNVYLALEAQSLE